MKVVSTKVTNPEWEALVDKCNESGVTISEYLRELLKEDSDEDGITITQEEKPTQSILDRMRKNRPPKGESGHKVDELSELVRLYHR